MTNSNNKLNIDMDIPVNTVLRDKIVESLINKDATAFRKYLQEARALVESELVAGYSNKIRKSLND